MVLTRVQDIITIYRPLQLPVNQYECLVHKSHLQIINSLGNNIQAIKTSTYVFQEKSDTIKDQNIRTLQGEHFVHKSHFHIMNGLTNNIQAIKILSIYVFQEK